MDATISQASDFAAYGQAVWSCPPDAGVKFAEMISERRRLSSPVLRGEHGVSRQTIVQGMPDCSALPVVTLLVCFFHFANEAAGAAGTRHSLRPRSSEGHDDASLGRDCVAGTASCVLVVIASEAKQSMDRA